MNPIRDSWESDDGAVRLLLGDAMEILPTLSGIDAVVTDPPFEKLKGGTVISHSNIAQVINDTVSVGTELGNADGLRLVQNVARLAAIAFCSFHWVDKCIEMLGGERRALVSWYKRNSVYSIQNAPWYMTEYAWAVQYAPGIDWKPLRTHIDVPMLQAGCFATERILKDGGKSAAHPTQKPLVVMDAVLLPGMDSVCDPYMGSGTTGVACIRTGRCFVGIEIERKYWEIAVRRCKAELERFPLFEPPKPKQLELIP